jgi:hypothetical protein
MKPQQQVSPAMTTINAPVDFSQTQGDLGLDFVFGAQGIAIELQDKLDVLNLGVVPLVGDLAGTGTDTLRVTHMGSVGFSRRMSSLASETDTITASSITTGYTEVSIGMHGLAHEETYQQQILSREPGVSLEAIIAQAPASWLATFRYLLCVEGATFSTIVGSATTTLSVDDWIDLITACNETLGFMGNPSAMLAPQQLTQLIASLRTEPAFQNLASDFANLQRVSGMQVKPNFAGLGIDVALTDDVVQSGGAYQGFGMSPGGIGWARASTASIKPHIPGVGLYVPEYGMFIERIAKGENGKARYEARAWLGVNSGSSDLFVQRLIRSVI